MKQRPTATARCLGALAAAALVLVTGCTSDDDGPGDAETPDATPGSSSSTGDEPELIEYADQTHVDGITIDEPAEVDQLTGAPDDFKEFITGVLAKAGAQCPNGRGVVTVQGIALGDDATATGGVGGCGGYVALWAVVDGEWKEVDGTQEVWDCSVLERYQPPADLVGDVCYDYDGDGRRHHYPRGSRP